MKRRLPLILMIFLFCLALSSCSAKLFVIRPTLIDRITIENLSTGESVELIRNDVDKVEWLMDDLVLQMAEFYKRDGKCTDEDGHLYEAVYYNGDRLELTVFINEDGSVCKNEGHYVLTGTEDEEIRDFLANWAQTFNM